MQCPSLDQGAPQASEAQIASDRIVATTAYVTPNEQTVLRRS